MNMHCEDIQSLFDPYLNGGLTKGDRDKLESHLQTCDACRSEFKTERRVIDGLQALPRVACPENVVDRIEKATYAGQDKERLHEKLFGRHKGHYWRMVPVGLAVAAAIVLLSILPLREDEVPVPQQYSEEDIEKARNEAKWSLAYIARTVSETEQEVLEDVLLKELPSTVQKSLKRSIPIFKGGQQ